jgi:hypothetical protein
MPVKILSLIIVLNISLFAAIGVFDSAEKYGEELSRYVESGNIDYKNWSGDHEGLDEFIESLKSVNLDSLSTDESKALLVNAYNAGMVWLILQNYPINGIFDIKPKVFEQKAINIGGEMLSLDEIENNLLRKLGDHRIHFVIVCGSIGCPDLSSEIYRPDILDRQLDSAAEKYLAQSKGMVIERDSLRVSLSSVFKWFGPDFGETNEERLIALSRYLEKEDAEFIHKNAGVIEIRYIEYNWSLNGE